MLVMSNSVLPSTSRSALASILPVKVESPLTIKEVKSPRPAGGNTPFAPRYLYPIRYTLLVVIPEGTLVPLKFKIPDE